jgi:glycosyltransferase involved in cell wall biosynthesis
MGYLSRLRRELRDVPGFLKEQQIDLVHLNMHVCVGTLLSANKLGIPVVTHYRSKTNDRPKIFYDLFLPWLHRRSAAVLCISEAVARHFVRRGLQTKVRVVPNPIDLERFHRPNPSNYFSTILHFQGKKVVLFVGRIHPQKQIHVLIEAVRLLAEKERSYALAIVGEAASDSADQKYAEDLRRQGSGPDFPAPVQWIPRQSNVAPMMTSADVFVLPSVDEGFGRVVVEAMASGVPVIGANSGAIPELTGDNQYGQLVPPGHPKELACAIDQALKDSHWKGVARQAREYVVKRFSVEEHVRALEEIYDTLLRIKES